MTGTASTSEVEFESIYNLFVETVKLNKPMIRNDFVDAVYQDELQNGKYADECENAYSVGCPVLSVPQVEIRNNLRLITRKRCAPSTFECKTREHKGELKLRRLVVSILLPFQQIWQVEGLI